MVTAGSDATGPAAPRATALPLLLLPGALGSSELLAPLARALPPTVRTLTFSYPPTATTGAALVAAILAHLDQMRLEEGTDRVAVAGFSFGGQVAQALVRRAPERVAALALVASGAPLPARGRAIARTLPLVRWLPRGLLAGKWRREVRALLAASDPATAEARERALAVVTRMTGAELVATRARLADLDRLADLRPVPAGSLAGGILLLDLERDGVITLDERAVVRALHPGALIEELPDLTHAATLTFPAALTSRLAAWIASLAWLGTRHAQVRNPAQTSRRSGV